MPLVIDLDPDGEIIERVRAREAEGQPSAGATFGTAVPLPGTDFVLPHRFALVYQPAGDEPSWKMTIAVRDGVPEVVSVLIEAQDGGRGVRSGDLRISVEDSLELATKNVMSRRVVDVPQTYADHVEDIRSGASVRAVRAARQATKRKVTDDVLREVARIYREHIDGNPTEAVRAHLGVADRTARLYVRRARDAGHLGKALPGKAGEH